MGAGQYFPRIRALTSVCGMLIGILTLSACQTPEQERYADQDACAGMGARYGSTPHTACMMQQQRRRDDTHLRFLEEARLNQKIAEDARRAQERIKRDRERGRD